MMNAEFIMVFRVIPFRVQRFEFIVSYGALS